MGQVALCVLSSSPASALEQPLTMMPQVTKVGSAYLRCFISGALTEHDDDDDTDYQPEIGHPRQAWGRRATITVLAMAWIRHIVTRLKQIPLGY
jgi:hypothetical protein